MSGYLWKATVRNVNRALKEINAFEWEGDYRAEARNRLKELLEERMDEELGQYLGRAKHERLKKRDPEDLAQTQGLSIPKTNCENYLFRIANLFHLLFLDEERDSALPAFRQAGRRTRNPPFNS